jgi:hypothetical protein
MATIFQPGSPLMTVRRSCRAIGWPPRRAFLPLSVNPRVSRELGTRHRAAIGLTEENDAVAVVVPRRPGFISLAMRGPRAHLTADTLRIRSAALLAAAGAAAQAGQPGRARLMAIIGFRHIGLKIMSIALAALLWLVVAGEQVVERALRIPLEFTNMPAQLEPVGEPPNVWTCAFADRQGG